jgi:enoyl-CoA hydratase
MDQQAAHYQRQDSIGIITLNRPQRLNAINNDLLRELLDCFRLATRDKEVAVVILTGEGRAFCAGQDLKETAGGLSIEEYLEEADALQEVQRLIMKMGKPLIGAVRGYALGGGCEFAMSCDIRIASEDAVFGFPETGVGLTVTTAGTKLLTQLVGLGKCKELILTGEFIDAAEAHRIGLANQVLPNEALMDEALKMARTIADRSPLATRLSRTAIDLGLDAGMEEILEIEANHFLICVQSQNQDEFVSRKLKSMKKDKD